MKLLCKYIGLFGYVEHIWNHSSLQTQESPETISIHSSLRESLFLHFVMLIKKNIIHKCCYIYPLTNNCFPLGYWKCWRSSIFAETFQTQKDQELFQGLLLFYISILFMWIFIPLFCNVNPDQGLARPGFQFWVQDYQNPSL